jgi:hypothetical protein
MTLHRLEMSQAVRNLITHLPPELKRKVRTAFRAIAADPHKKELKDELAGCGAVGWETLDTFGSQNKRNTDVTSMNESPPN